MKDKYQEILLSHVNGQMAQMLRQINEFGRIDFTHELEDDHTLSLAEKFDIVRKYMLYSK